MIEQFNFDIRLIFAILNGKVSLPLIGNYTGTSDRTVWKSVRSNGRFLFFSGKKTE